MFPVIGAWGAEQSGGEGTMVDPGIHAEMTILIRREKELQRIIEELETEEIPLWEKRVKLADQKGMSDLADEAAGRVAELRHKIAESNRELESIEMQKSMLRYESKRPSGREVERAEAMVESVRLAGLVDPDKSEWDKLQQKQSDGLHEDSGALLDFGDDD